MDDSDRRFVDLARLWCSRCDERGFTWRDAAGAEVLPEDPRGVTAARCRHPATHRRQEPWIIPDAFHLDELTQDELAELEAVVVG